MATRNGDPPASPSASIHSFLAEDPYHSGSPRSSSRMSSLPPHLLGTDGDSTGDESLLTQSSLLNRLETLLRAKAEEVQLAGQLGQALLSQQQELEGRIRDIAEVAARFADRQSSSGAGRSGDGGDSSDESEAREVGEETKKSLRALEEELERWGSNNQDLYQVVGTAAARGVPALGETDAPRPRAPSLSLNGSSRRPSMADLAASASDASIASAASPAPALDASAARRVGNTAQHRTNDIELATEIGQSLLVEVRRLQALLQEKEEHVRAVERERDGMAQEAEQAMAQKKQVEEASERFKEVNWELELASQDLRTALSTAQGSLQKAEAERARHAKDLATTRDALDLQRLESERVAKELELLKAKHETDMANMRKAQAGLQRDKSDLQGTLEGLKSELATRARAIRRGPGGSPAPGTPGYRGPSVTGDDDEDGFAPLDEDDVFRSTARRRTGEGFPSSAMQGEHDAFGVGDSPSASPIQRSGFATEGDALRASLAHAQRQISTLRTSLQREKQAKMELRRQLVGGEAGKGGARGEKIWGDDPLDGSDSDEDIAGAHDSGTNDRGDEGDSFVTEDSENTSLDALSSGRTPAKQQLGAGWPRSARGSARGSGRGRGSAVRRGGSAMRVPSRLAKALVEGDHSDVSTEETAHSPAAADPAAEDSFDAHEGGSIFEHQFGGELVGAAMQSDGDVSFEVDSPTRNLGSSVLGRSQASMLSRRQRAMSAETEGSQTSFDGVSPAGATLGDMLGDDHSLYTHQRTAQRGQRPGSIGSLASILGRTRAASDRFDAVSEEEDGSRDNAMHSYLTGPVSPMAATFAADSTPVKPARVSWSDKATFTDFAEPEPRERIVEREVRVEVPVDRIVEVPVDRIVEVPVDRIVEREVRVEVPVDRVVEVPVDRVVEREVRVEVPVDRIVEVPVDRAVDRIVEREVRVEVPVDRVVEREVRVEVPVDRVVEREVRVEVPVDRIVEVPVDRAVDRIVEREVRVEVPIDRVVEREVRVEVPVDRVVEVPVDRIVEREVRVEVPVDRIVEVPVDRIVEREVRVEVPVDRIVEVPVDRVVEVPVDRVVEREVRIEVPIEVIREIEVTVAKPEMTDAGVQAIFDLPSTAVPAAVARMEARALPHQASLSDLTERGPFARNERDQTISSFAQLQGLRAPVQARGPTSESSEDDARSEATDRGGPSRQTYYTDTDTERDYEDARESLGGAASSLGGRPSFATAPRYSFSDGSNPSRSTSINDFVSVRSGRTTAFGDETDSEVEVLAGTHGEAEHADMAGAFRRTLRGRPADLAIAPEQPLKAEVETQTEQWAPEPLVETIYVDKVVYVDRPVDKIVYVDRPVTVEKIVRVEVDRPVKVEVERIVEKVVYVDRPTATTTEAPAEARVHDAAENAVDDLDVSAATASAFLGDDDSRPATPSPSLLPSSAMSTVARDGKGNDREIMGPPPLPSARKAPEPRRSGSSIASGKSLRPPPPRPTSPPPADLLFRAQSPTWDAEYSRRASAFLAPPVPSTTAPTLRSQASALSSAGGSATPRSAHRSRRQASEQTSSSRSLSRLSRRSDDGVSRRLSLASEATSDGGYDLSEAPPLPGMLSAGGDSTDPEVIHAITQTMIGEFLHKYTRRRVGKGLSDKRHRRYVWLHPYSRTLYWSQSDPGAHTTNYTAAKSAHIEAVRQVLDPNPLPPGLHQHSLIIKTRDRDIAFTASSKERHDLWYRAIQYLLSRPDGAASTGASATDIRSDTPAHNATPRRARHATDQDYFAVSEQVYSFGAASVSDSRLTPRAHQPSARASRSDDGRRGSIPLSTPRSGRSFAQDLAEADSLEVVDRDGIPEGFSGDEGEDTAFDGLENLRACCGGKHDVGSLSRRRHSHSRSKHSHSDAGDSVRSTTPAPRPKSSSTTLGSLSRKMGRLATPRKSVSSTSTPIPASTTSSRALSPIENRKL